jgi:DNA-directed RNA polymerase subunit M/transcription elongation factor TFIIS
MNSIQVNEALRNRGREAIATVIKKPNNVIAFESLIFEKTSQDREVYTWVVYQTVGLLLEISFSDWKTLASDLKSGKIGWKNRCYDEIALTIEEFDNYLIKPFEVMEGVKQCVKCNSKKTWSIPKQIRSGDEGTSVISRCSECEYQWVSHG